MVAAALGRIRILSVPLGRLGTINPRLLTALIVALMYHGGLTFAGSYQGTYDAWIHIFFADSYSRSWFDPWEPRWYTGFLTTSYPPGTHQSMALLSNLVDLQTAFSIVQTFSLMLATIGMYRFTKIWYDEGAAGYAALGFVFSSAIAETVHVFGQLPTTASLAFLLNALPFGHKYLMEGGFKNLYLAIAVTMATTAAHHVTTLFGSVFFLAPTILGALLAYSRFGPEVDRTDWPIVKRVFRRIALAWPAIKRAALLGFGTIGALLIVVLPYWLWSASDPIVQVPIPHGSRDNFLENRNTGLMFWVIPWGLQLLAFPYMFIRAFKRDRWPVAASALLMFVLGTGGTTPIPRALLGKAFDILTLDRFTFWAVMLTIPSLGAMAFSLFHGDMAKRLHRWVSGPVRRAVQIGFALSFVVLSLWVSNLTQFRPLQPASIDPGPIVEFMEKDQHDRWRYMTLGFGDQMAWVSAQMEAQQIDGNYHSARRLPELTSTSVERLEGAKFRGIPGIGSLQQFLAVPDKYALKFIFSNDQFYDPLLYFSGWHRVGTLINGIVVWERVDITPLPEVLPRTVLPMYQRVMWGVLPMTAYGLAAIAFFIHGTDRLRRRLKGHSFPVEDHSTPKIDYTAIPRRSKAQRRSLSLVVLLTVLGGLAYTGDKVLAAPTPEEVVVEYYEDLAFRRMGEVYEALDPVTRPSFDQYMIERSVEDGLVASYSILDSVYVEILKQEDGFIELEAEIVYVTALEEYTVKNRHNLFLRDGRWYIEPPASELTEPPERFFRRGEVVFGAAGRRRVTTGTTAEADVLDRPEVNVLGARLVRFQERMYIVGEIVNTDVDPSDLTLTGQIVDPEGEVITWYNAQQVVVSKIRALESSPFRIDFEGVAGAVDVHDPAAGSFRPNAFTPLGDEIVSQPIGSVQVYAKAMVTARVPSRGLVVQDIETWLNDDDEVVIEGTLLNTATIGATVPHVLVTLYDEAGEVVWIDHTYLPQGVRTGRTLPFEVTVPNGREIEVIWDDVSTFDNGLTSGTLAQGVAPPDLVDAPEGSGYQTMRVLVVAYWRAFE